METINYQDRTRDKMNLLIESMTIPKAMFATLTGYGAYIVSIMANISPYISFIILVSTAIVAVCGAIKVLKPIFKKIKHKKHHHKTIHPKNHE